MILAAGAGGLLLICMMACCCCKTKGQNKVEIIENNRIIETSPREVELSYNQKPGQGNDTSVELEDVDDDEHGHQRRSSGNLNE